MSVDLAAADGKSLSKGERVELAKCEQTIETARKSVEGSFMAIGLALRKVQDGRLYREKYGTFEAYCRRRWEFTRSRAYRLIAGSKTVETVAHGQQIQTERQARALAAVPPEERQAVVDQATSNDEPLTARRIAETAGSVIIDMDQTGMVIPDEVLADWRRAMSFAETLRKLSDVKCTVDDALKAQDRIFAEVSNTTVAELNHSYAILKCVIPYAVCPTCAGHKPDRCALCRGRGFLSKFAWNSYVPEEIRKARVNK